MTSNAYDFANRMTKTRRDHTATPPNGSLKTHTIREEYVYDEASRLRFTRHKINTNNWVVTAAPIYDELSRLQDKRLHASNYDGVSNINLNSSFNYLQSLDYSYNIRGWLISMNDPTSCVTQGGDQLADLFIMGLDYESTANGATAQYNGNISAMQWRTNVNGSCMTRQQYRFTYDYSNRLLTANHFTHNGSSWVNTNNYSESNITYDFNGNIKTYTRRGLTAPATYGIIDQLTYTFGDAARPDRLTNMAEAGSATKGFIYTSGAAAYQYDLNGNLTQDNHKALSMAYNHLNLPNYIVNPGDADISLNYSADGEKLTKVSIAGTRNYVSGIEYLGANLEAIYHAEGRCTPNGSSAFYYEYTIKDHLGSARINFRANGTAVTFQQELHYYPFGMLMEGIGTAPVTNNGYKYNGKELNEDLGLNWSDFGARWYDPAIARFPSVDPIIDKFPYLTPYNYASNDPVGKIDLWGLQGVSANRLGNDNSEALRTAQSVTASTSVTLVKSEAVRNEYVSKVSSLEKTDSKGRTQLKTEAREKTPAVMREVAEQMRPSSSENLRSMGTASKTNEGVNSLVGKLGTVGKVAGAAAVGISVYNVATAENKPQALATEGGAIAGAIIGGEIGAEIGAGIGVLFGGVGAVPGAIIGGVIGSISGGILGATAGTKTYDAITTKKDEQK